MDFSDNIYKKIWLSSNNTFSYIFEVKYPGFPRPEGRYFKSSNSALAQTVVIINRTSTLARDSLFHFKSGIMPIDQVWS